MRNVLLAAATAIGALFSHSAQAWETVVRDTHGLRTVELRGFSQESESSGVALACYPDSGDAAVIFAQKATRDFSLRPGAGVTILIDGMELPAELLSNDSAETSAVAQGVNVAVVLAHLASRGGATTANLVEMRNAELMLGGDRWKESAIEFTTACGL